MPLKATPVDLESAGVKKYQELELKNPDIWGVDHLFCFYYFFLNFGFTKRKKKTTKKPTALKTSSPKPRY